MLIVLVKGTSFLGGLVTQHLPNKKVGGGEGGGGAICDESKMAGTVSWCANTLDTIP